jgi:P-type Cu2+ transporter
MKMTEHSHHDMADTPMTENMADHDDMSQHHMHMTADPGMANMDMTDMKRRFWWSFGLMIPIIIITPFMGLSLPFTLTFPGSNWVTAILSVLLYFIGSKPFFDGAKSEIKAKKPAMMSLVSMGLLVTFWYSIYALLANQFVHGTHIMDFFWEFATLTVIMLLGHRIEMAATMKSW